MGKELHVEVSRIRCSELGGYVHNGSRQWEEKELYLE